MSASDSGTKVSVTKAFLDALLQRGIEKGAKEGYQQGLTAGKEESKKAEAEAHALGVTNGLLWGLNCPQSFRLHWEQTGRLLYSMPTSVTTLKTATSHLINFDITHLVEADHQRHLPSNPSSDTPTQSPSINLVEVAPAAINLVDSADYSHDPLLEFIPQSPPLQWSDEPPDCPQPPQLPPRDFSGLRTDPQAKPSLAWSSLQRRKRRHPRKLQSPPLVFAVSSFKIDSKLPNIGPGSWVFIPSGLRSVVLRGDEDAAVFCGGQME